MVEQRFCKAKAIGSNPLAGFPAHPRLAAAGPIQALARHGEGLPVELGEQRSASPESWGRAGFCGGLIGRINSGIPIQGS